MIIFIAITFISQLIFSTIKVDEDNKNIIIDYTNLFKIDNNNLTKEVVSIKYSNINKINSLEK